MTTIPKPSGKVRWIVCGLLFAAVVLSYIDRLVLPTLKPALQARYGWSESGYADLAIWFQAGYGIAYVAFGRLIDRIGARAGYALAVGLWTVGHVMHIFFTSTAGMLFARIPLAIGEAGAANAGILAAQILALSDEALAARLAAFRAALTDSVAETVED